MSSSLRNQLTRYWYGVRKSIAPLPERTHGRVLKFTNWREAIQTYRDTWQHFESNNEPGNRTDLNSTNRQPVNDPEQLGRNLATQGKANSRRAQEIAKEYGIVFRDTLYAFLQGYKEGKDEETAKGVIEHDALTSLADNESSRTSPTQSKQ